MNEYIEEIYVWMEENSKNVIWEVFNQQHRDLKCYDLQFLKTREYIKCGLLQK